MRVYFTFNHSVFSHTDEAGTAGHFSRCANIECMLYRFNNEAFALWTQYWSVCFKNSILERSILNSTLERMFYTFNDGKLTGSVHPPLQNLWFQKAAFGMCSAPPGSQLEPRCPPSACSRKKTATPNGACVRGWSIVR